MAVSDSPPASTSWLTLAEVAERIGDSPSRVRRLLDENYLVASRRYGTVQIPDVLLVEAEPLATMRGTVTVLRDAGLNDDEIIDWLLAPEESLGDAPIVALRAGRTHEVRRIARTLG